MLSKFNIEEFINILEKDSLVKAIEYKERFVPKMLYKYFPLFDEQFSDYQEKNKKILDSIEAKKIWISSPEKLNDPFEYKMLNWNIERLKKAGWKIKSIATFSHWIKNGVFTTCFSANENNMPLWAHYANNHSGFCVKYKVSKSKFFYPVLYVRERIKAAVIPREIIKSLNDVFKENKPTRPDEVFYKDFDKYMIGFFVLLCCKDEAWQYENEYRILYPVFDHRAGKLVTLEEIGVELDSIFIGLKTKEEHRKRLITLAEKFNCNLYEMHFNEYSEEFKLEPKQVL